MPRALWKGSIRLGMLTVPVKLYSAVRSRGIGFRMLHDQDLAPIRHAMVCPVDDEEIPAEHRVKGFEVRKGEYVIVTKEELAALEPEASREIHVEDFIDREAIDSTFFDTAYYLGPDTGGADGYRLLVAAILKAGKTAVVRWVMRKREYLGALQLAGEKNNVLYVETLHYPDEVLDPDGGFDLAKVKYTAGERKMAGQLVDSLAGEFDPSEFKDDFTEKVMNLLERKAAGEKIKLPAAHRDAAKAPRDTDLTRILRASIKAAESTTPRASNTSRLPARTRLTRSTRRTPRRG